jgi:serine/threonine protein kinase
LQPPPGTTGKSQASQKSESGDVTAVLRMRLWAYGAQPGKLSELAWEEDKAIAELVQDTVQSGHGAVAEKSRSGITVRFEEPLQALSTAKSLQQRFLSFHRDAPDGQVVASIVVENKRLEAAPDEAAAGENLLVEAHCAQILVGEGICDLARTIPGFDFSSKPVREAAEGGLAEALYELRWTDESTYGHLRKTNRPAAPEVSPDRRYTIRRELGRGCMGVVYEAYDEVIGRSVALKTIAVNRSFPNRDELIERLKQEAKAAGSLDHPNIITIYDVGQEEDLLYLSMQLVEGKTLSAVMAENSLPPLMTLLSYAEQICNAVGFAHRKGVIHRDLKPANFMVTEQGTVKVLDFGIAKLEDANLTQTGMIVGTPTYMAPEQAKAKKIDHRSDIFSLGSVFYELFTREKPFKGDITTVLYKLVHEDVIPPSLMNPSLPISIDTIIRKALAKDPANRFQSCEEMRDAFRQQAVLLQQPTPMISPAASEDKPSVTVDDLLAEVRPRRQPNGKRIGIGITLCILLAAAGATAWAWRTKITTGSYPPVLNRAFLALKAEKAKLVDTAASGDAHPQTPSGGSGAAPDGLHADGSPAASENAGSTQPAQVQPAGGAADATAVQPSNQAAQNPPPQPQTSQAPTVAPAESPQERVAERSDSGTVVSTETNKGQSAEPNPVVPRKRAQKTSVADADSSVKVEGFSRRDIPDLLSRADDAAGRGDYRLARYEYNIILRLDRQNAAAKAGLRRVTEAEEDR